MAKAGRKRKPDVKRRKGNASAKAAEPTAAEVKGVARWNRLKEALARNLEDPRWGSELGRLHFQERISSLQREAGERFIAVVDNYYTYGLGGVSVRPKISKMERASPGETATDPKRAARAQDAYDKVYSEVVETRGTASWRAVFRLCVEDEHLAVGEFLLAQATLELLAQVFGLTGRAKTG